MPHPGLTSRLDFPHRIRGAQGSFTIAGNRCISFLTTRFGARQLAQVQTARQVLPRKQLRVTELMQRDIDDSRVQNEIIGYLNPTTSVSNSRFFPPIVVGVLPRKPASKELADLYPEPTLTEGHFPRIPDPADQNILYEEQVFGDVFALRVPLSSNSVTLENNAFFHATELLWDDSRAYLFAIDGQHRLLALQAILGVLPEDERMRGYTDLPMSPPELEEVGFSSVPVCIVFPPMLYSGNPTLTARDTVVTVFRELFVDINKNAKVVSESRNILLNERDAISVFTRNTIGSFVIEGDLPEDSAVNDDDLPLYAFEFESDKGKGLQITDARAVSSVGVMRKLISNLLVPGERDERDTDTFRRELGIEDNDAELDPEECNQSRGVSPDEIDDEHFEPWQLDVLLKRFEDRWQQAIVTIVRLLYPAADLVSKLEQKRCDLQTQAQERPDDWVPRHSLAFLVGTSIDQRQISAAAEKPDDQIVGPFEPISCRKAKIEIEQFFDQLRDQKQRDFGRLFFSQVGQAELFHFVFTSLRNNASDDDVDRLVLSAAFVKDFNEGFKGTNAERLFARDAEWNEPVIRSLGTYRYIQQHIRGLLEMSLAFIGGDAGLHDIMGGETSWATIRSTFCIDGYQRVSETIAQRLKNQIQRTSEMLLIDDKQRRKKKVEEKVQSHLNEVLSRLRDFVRSHGHNVDEIIEKLK